mmetsp:Transcript_33995/g.105846  ORF Transcript_33995/g.105846 Transcript_33995/m.105846 type:complete len:210 (-) Transcript_33995:98-727(-)
MDREGGPGQRLHRAPPTRRAGRLPRDGAGSLPEQLQDGPARADRGLLAQRRAGLERGIAEVLPPLLQTLLRPLPLGRGHVYRPVPGEGPEGEEGARRRAAHRGPLRPSRGVERLQGPDARRLPPLQEVEGLQGMHQQRPRRRTLAGRVKALAGAGVPGGHADGSASLCQYFLLLTYGWLETDPALGRFSQGHAKELLLPGLSLTSPAHG